jgi:hypothetical protein
MLKWISIILVTILLGLGGYLYFSYSYVFSDGVREGVLNKFSTKGIVFKTNEGEILQQGLIQGMNQISGNFFYFSVENPEVKKQMDMAVGKKVHVHYVQYKGSLPWRGDNYAAQNKEEGQYIVDKVEIVK